MTQPASTPDPTGPIDALGQAMANAPEAAQQGLQRAMEQVQKMWQEMVQTMRQVMEQGGSEAAATIMPAMADGLSHLTEVLP